MLAGAAQARVTLGFSWEASQAAAKPAALLPGGRAAQDDGDAQHRISVNWLFRAGDVEIANQEVAYGLGRRPGIAKASGGSPPGAGWPVSPGHRQVTLRWAGRWIRRIIRAGRRVRRSLAGQSLRQLFGRCGSSGGSAEQGRKPRLPRGTVPALQRLGDSAGAFTMVESFPPG